MSRNELIASWRTRLTNRFLHLREIMNTKCVNIIFDLDFNLTGGDVIIKLEISDYLKFTISCTIVDELIQIRINRYVSISLDVVNFVEYVYRNIIAPEIDRVKQFYTQGL